MKKILLVEDDYETISILAELLVSEGFQCVEAIDGNLAKGRLSMEGFDLIICDLRMPSCDGVALLEWCESQHLQMPKIVMTACSHLASREQNLIASVKPRLVTKPFDVDDFISIVRQEVA